MQMEHQPRRSWARVHRGPTAVLAFHAPSDPSPAGNSRLTEHICHFITWSIMTALLRPRLHPKGSPNVVRVHRHPRHWPGHLWTNSGGGKSTDT